MTLSDGLSRRGGSANVIAEILERCDTIEECYEFMLGYAAQGLPGDAGSPRVREFLRRAADAVRGLRHEPLEHDSALAPFLGVLRRDAADSLAALELVLAQPVISSQLIDNLNASIHLRALLTDLFLLGEILRTQAALATTA